MFRVRCRKCDNFIRIPAYEPYDRDIYITVSVEPLMHQRSPVCKECWYDWHEIQARISREFLGPEKLDPTKEERKKPLPDLKKWRKPSWKRRSKPMLILKFQTETCGPCKMMAPIVASVAEELGVEVKEVDATQSTDAINFGISAVPTIIVMDGSIELGRHVGLIPKPQLKEWLISLQPNGSN